MFLCTYVYGDENKDSVVLLLLTCVTARGQHNYLFFHLSLMTSDMRKRAVTSCRQAWAINPNLDMCNCQGST